MSDLDDIVALESSGLFDRHWYLAVNPDVVSAGLDPLIHYFRFGWAEARRPNAYFHSSWYLKAANLSSGTEPLLHYMRTGEKAGIPPNPLFDVPWYRAAYQLRSGDLALADFLKAPPQLRAPSPSLFGLSFMLDSGCFPAAWSRADYIDACAASGQQPDVDQTILSRSGLFDENYYLINGSDVLESSMTSIQHYCKFGWMENRNPCLYFNTAWYLKTNPEVVRLGINPLTHYAVQGEASGRRPSVFFDPDYYRHRYAVPRTQSALAHFLANRRTQCFSPTELFDVEWYVDRHRSDLGRSGDPFAHFLQAGTYGDVDPSPAFSSSDYRLRRMGRRTRHFRRVLDPDADNPLLHHLHATYR